MQPTPLTRPASVTTPLRVLLGDVARTDLAAPGWDALTARAAAATGDLAAAGRLPHHLVVAPTDPPVVVARLLAAAMRPSRVRDARAVAAPARCA